MKPSRSEQQQRQQQVQQQQASSQPAEQRQQQALAVRAVPRLLVQQRGVSAQPAMAGCAQRLRGLPGRQGARRVLSALAAAADTRVGTTADLSAAPTAAAAAPAAAGMALRAGEGGSATCKRKQHVPGQAGTEEAAAPAGSWGAEADPAPFMAAWAAAPVEPSASTPAEAVQEAAAAGPVAAAEGWGLPIAGQLPSQSAPAAATVPLGTDGEGGEACTAEDSISAHGRQVVLTHPADRLQLCGCRAAVQRRPAEADAAGKAARTLRGASG